jgi:hypothetical protein
MSYKKATYLIVTLTELAAHIPHDTHTEVTYEEVTEVTTTWKKHSTFN